jgi:hypothetical protein
MDDGIPEASQCLQFSLPVAKYGLQLGHAFYQLDVAHSGTFAERLSHVLVDAVVGIQEPDSGSSLSNWFSHGHPPSILAGHGRV